MLNLIRNIDSKIKKGKHDGELPSYKGSTVNFRLPSMRPTDILFRAVCVYDGALCEDE